jgi:hypothetical protein
MYYIGSCAELLRSRHRINSLVVEGAWDEGLCLVESIGLGLGFGGGGVEGGGTKVEEGGGANAPQGIFSIYTQLQKNPIRLKNKSCRPSPVVWGKHRSKWSTRTGSVFFRSLFELVFLEFCRNKITPL